MSKKLSLMIKNKLEMKNIVKIISAVFSVMALSFFVSCDTEEVKKTDNDGSLELNDSGAISVQKRSGGEKVIKKLF